MIKVPKFQNIYKIITALSKREKTILYAAIVFVLLTLLDRLIVYPIYSKIKSLNNEIAQKEVAINRDMRVVAQKERIAKEINDYSSFLVKSQSEDEDMTAFLKDIEVLANNSSLYIIDMKPTGSKEGKEKTRKYFLTLNCEGQMEQIMAFIYSVETAKQLMAVEKYQIVPKSKDSSLAQCSMTLAKVFMTE